MLYFSKERVCKSIATYNWKYDLDIVTPFEIYFVRRTCNRRFGICLRHSIQFCRKQKTKTNSLRITSRMLLPPQSSLENNIFGTSGISRLRESKNIIPRRRPSRRRGFFIEALLYFTVDGIYHSTDYVELHIRKKNRTYL